MGRSESMAQHLRKQQRARRSQSLALLLHHSGRGLRGGELYGESDKQGSSPVKDPVHPTELVATVYYAMGIDPSMEVLNDLKQPRPLVYGSPLTRLF